MEVLFKLFRQLPRGHTIKIGEKYKKNHFKNIVLNFVVTVTFCKIFSSIFFNAAILKLYAIKPDLV